MAKSKFEWTADKQLFVLVIGVGFFILILSAFQFLNHRQYCVEQGYENTTDWEVIADTELQIGSTFFQCDNKYRFEKKYMSINYTDRWGQERVNNTYVTERLK